MPWEAVTAIATAFTGLVIFFTVVLGARQVRAAAEQTKAMSAQLEQLRRATQLEGALAVFNELRGGPFRQAYNFVTNELRERIKDEAFLNEALRPGVDLDVHKERYLLNTFEEIGVYVKDGLLDARIVLDYSAYIVKRAWESLADFVALQRHALSQPLTWDKFEYLYHEAVRFIEAETEIALGR